MKTVNKGFTMIEMVIIIVLIGIIGSIAADMLFQGADIYVSETNRQSFISESRSAFWKLMRQTQGQSSPADFTLSDQNSLYLKNGKNEQFDFQTESPSDFTLRLGIDNQNYRSLSNSLSYSESPGFTYLNNTFNTVTPSQGSLSLSEAETVHLIKLELTFLKNEDKLSLSSHVYPHNFRFGKKMSYHN